MMNQTMSTCSMLLGYVSLAGLLCWVGLRCEPRGSGQS
jgi:hypothetical protein